jgi:hypothetical protein
VDKYPWQLRERTFDHVGVYGSERMLKRALSRNLYYMQGLFNTVELQCTKRHGPVNLVSIGARKWSS